jgi:hypothetical protein
MIMGAAPKKIAQSLRCTEIWPLSIGHLTTKLA